MQGLEIKGNVLLLIPVIKAKLEACHTFDKSRRILKKADAVIFPVIETSDASKQEIFSNLLELLNNEDITISWLADAPNLSSKRAMAHSHSVAGTVLYTVQEFLNKFSFDHPISDFDMPCKFEIFDNYILFGETSFGGPVWADWFRFLSLKEPQTSCNIFYQKLSFYLKKPLLAVKQRIPVEDIQRRPQIKILYGFAYPGDLFQLRDSCQFSQGFWTSVTQNGVKYHWCPLFTMFSAGNISEKQRMQRICEANPSDVVVDLYAGIGYWSLVFAKSSKVQKVYACELNPWSVEGLARGLESNLITPGKVVILPGNNENAVSHFRGKANRVILGLIPSSQQGWPLAVHAMHPSGATFHVHANLTEREVITFQTATEAHFLRLIRNQRPELAGSQIRISTEQVENVKNYAPKVFHYVFDISIKVS